MNRHSYRSGNISFLDVLLSYQKNVILLSLNKNNN